MRFVKVVCYLICVIIGFFSLVLYVNSLYPKNAKDSSKGTCYFKYWDDEGCIGANNENDCIGLVSKSGADFEKFVKGPPKDKCEYTNARDLFIDVIQATLNLKDVTFPSRHLLNYDIETYWGSKYAIIEFVIVPYVFVVSFLTLVFLRRKHPVISYPLSLLVSLLATCLTLSSIDVIDHYYQYYVKIGTNAYLLSELLYFFTFSYLFVYLFSAFVYHWIKFRKREMTPLLQRIYFLADDVKGSFEH